mmetsp:Transcript_13380/g.29240  ORF Transcript_13380/g.29240 Transcript_13380/m.29240 type:complete len:1023 (-) Transcript_13380:235-3303(-)|eukprot:CAMPEP_0206447062 /NCGR_PEP_ID=MMETSP0324_2-20121206/16543_1 /ASSEMBLY_ACC=CAM_ASM_000836 /TAXON_ID=2866 /ORGANISM="Crypthecodinium cohnii, Strain Seligo" /LENGTH=1022 /DNA_ID=CAMNT_0053915723 /DNA_START=465 /DNA_END=3533 /DNA_ORIENTATION=-
MAEATLTVSRAAARATLRVAGRSAPRLSRVLGPALTHPHFLRRLGAACVHPSQAPSRAFFWSHTKGGDGDGKGDGKGDGNGSNKKNADEKTQGAATEAAKQKAESAAAELAEEAEGASLPVPLANVGGGLRKDSPAFQPNLMVLPLQRRPLFPGQQQIMHITNEEVLKALRTMEKSGQPLFVGAFLLRNADALAEAQGPLEELDEDEQTTPGSSQKSQLEAFHGIDNPVDAVYNVGTRARILQVLPFARPSPDGVRLDGIQVLLQGYELISLQRLLTKGPPVQVEAKKLDLSEGENSKDDTTRAYVNETMHTIREIMKVNPQFREHAAMIHHGLERLEKGDPHAIAHFAASLTTATGAELMSVLETEKPAEKLRIALELLKKELDLSHLQVKLATQIEEKVSSRQREYMLREQLKMIKKELGEDKSDGTDKLLEKFKANMEGKEVPKDVQEAIDQEMEKFANLAKESQEYQMTRNYLEWLTQMPWGAHTTDTLSLSKAREILDRDHYGLNEVKERIQELIAVGALKGSVQGKILCLVGPPGVGKTSIGRSVAEALGREFYRFSVGGLYDVAEIKGHRRTYVGAMPGKIIQALKKVQSSNPLILVDEVDKIGRGHQGDPASALLELLDPSQNYSFVDHYLDVPVDCSRVLFLCTANVTDTIPGPLLDRMEVIRLSGYDLQEKVKIAEEYLVPNSMFEMGLWDNTHERTDQSNKGNIEEATSEFVEEVPEETPNKEVSAPPEDLASKAAIQTEAIESLIRWYCRESGVRNLQKHVEKICRKLATRLVEFKEKVNGSAEVTPETESVDLVVTEKNLKDFVGKPLFLSDRLYDEELPVGTVTGLAWTSMGGSVLYIEAVGMPRPTSAKGSTPSLKVTGQLGNVMQESSQIALLNARRQVAVRAPEGRQAYFEDHDVHIHCPEGATPKDGPSAGVTMTTSMLSLALDRPPRRDLAMTGEISLNGKVLPVGGIKEKTIAARRAGCHALVFPEANQRDFDELPDYLRDGLEVHFAKTYDDVFKVAFPED